MSARTRTRRHVLAGVGAAAVTTAAVLGGPSLAAAAPADETSSPAAEETMDPGAGTAGSEGTDPGDADESGSNESGSGESGSTESGSNDSGDLIPQDLQQDLSDLRDLPADQQSAALQDLLDRARAGEYGERVQSAVQDLQDAWSGLPSDLRDDLTQALGQQDPQQGGDDLGQVYEDARNGEYGEAVESWTDWAAGMVHSLSADSGSSGSN